MRPVYVLALVATFCLLRTTAPAVTWDSPTAYPDDDFRTRNAKMFAESVKGASNGRLNPVVFGDSSLLPGAQIEPALRTNRVPIGLLDLSAAADTSPVLAFSSLPFLAATYVDSLRLWNAARPVVQRRLGARGMLVLYALPQPPAALFSGRQVTRASDLQGAPIVVDDPWLGRLVTHIGASPVPFEAAGVAQVFADRRAAMLAPPGVGERVEAWRFADNAYDVQASFPLSVVAVSQQAFSTLDEQSQRALLNASVRAQNDAWAGSIDQRNTRVAALGANGLIIQSVPPSLMEDLQRAGSEITAEWRAGAGPDAASILNAFGSPN